MAAGTAPIFPDTVNVDWGGNMTAANTTKDLTSGTIELVFTAGADGAFVYEIVFRAKGTNVQSVARLFLNNGGATGTAANNTLIGEIRLPATTLTETDALVDVRLPVNKAIDASYRLYVTLGTGVAAGWQATAFAGDY